MSKYRVHLMVAILGLRVATGLAQTPISDEFTYQGRLESNGAPASGTYDIRFRLFGAAAGGTSLQNICRNDVAVADGLFTVPLDPAVSVIDGNQVYLEISVRSDPTGTQNCPNDNGYTTLAPRQALSATPYAAYALAAAPGSVLTAPDGSPALALSIDNSGTATVFAGTDVAPTGGGVLILSDLAGTNIGIDGNEIMARNNGAVAKLSINANGGDVTFQESGAGNVGVGLGNPAAPLHVTGGADASLGSGGNIVSGPISGRNVVMDNDEIMGRNNGATGYLRLNSQGGDVRLIETGGGNVGIGTAFPARKLDVLDADSSTTARFTNTSTGAAVSGYSDFGNGLYGNGAIGVYALSTTGTGVFAQGQEYGVHASAIPSSGVVFGVRGTTESSSGTGVAGINTATTGTANGVSGATFSAHGRGVFGTAPSSASVNYGVYGQTFSATGWGVYANGDLGASGAKAFEIDHPLDPANKYLRHYCMEGPDALNIYRGNVELGDDGSAWVELPDYFEAINKEFQYQLTCIGGFAPVYVAQEARDNRFQIAGGKEGLRVSWTVTGVRNDAYMRAYRKSVEEAKPAEHKGRFLHPELYGQPDELRVGGDVYDALRSDRDIHATACEGSNLSSVWKDGKAKIARQSHSEP